MQGRMAVVVVKVRGVMRSGIKTGAGIRQRGKVTVSTKTARPSDHHTDAAVRLIQLCSVLTT